MMSENVARNMYNSQRIINIPTQLHLVGQFRILHRPILRYSTKFLDFRTEHNLPPTRLLIPLHVNEFYHNCTYSRFPEDEHSGSKHVEEIVKIKMLA